MQLPMKEQLQEFQTWIKKHQTRFPYLHNEIENFYQSCLDEIKKGKNIKTAIEESKEKTDRYIFR